MPQRRIFDEPPHHERHYVRNQSDRRGPVIAVIMHSTESQDLPRVERDLDGIQSWFNNPQSQASAHVGIDGDGHSRVWVPIERKAWTAGAANSWSGNIELVGRAAQPVRQWELAQIKTAAKWAAYWCHRFNIPAQVGTVKNIAGQCVCTKKGLLRHIDITRAGFGSHQDPGTFPFGEFLEYVQWYKRHGWYRQLTDRDLEHR